MKEKNLLVVLLALVFMLSINMPTGVAESTTTVYVNPSEIKDFSLKPDEVFTIEIAVANVENLRGYQFEMTFNPEVLKGIGVDVGPFLGSAGGRVLRIEGEGFDNTKGTLSLTGAILREKSATVAPDGDGVLATVTFQVVAYGGSNLKLGPNTGLWGIDGSWIIHGLENVGDGYFANTEVHDISVASIVCAPDTVYQGDPIFITVEVENRGEFTETFDVEIFAVHWGTGTYIFISKETVDSLASGDSITLSFVWDTTDVPLGTYEVYAEATGVPGEAGQTTNNIASTTFGGIGAPPHEVTLLELIVKWMAVVVKFMPVVAATMIAVVFFKSLMSVKMRRPVRLLGR